MAKNEQMIYVEINGSEVDTLTGQMTGLKHTVTRLGAELTRAFSLSEMTASLKEAVQASGNLDKELLVLRLGLGKLKAAIGDAAAPLGAVFLPAVNQAVWAATRMVKTVGKIIGSLFGYSEATEDSAKSQAAMTKSSGKLQRTLMGFDEINRLNGRSGGSSAAEPVVTTGKVDDTLSPQLQAVVEKIRSLVEPLKKIDFTPAVNAFGKLKEAIAPIGRTLFSGLEWAWHNLLVPLAAWTVEDFLPAFLKAVSGALGVLNSVITALQPMADWLWERFLKPLAQWSGERILAALGWLQEKLTAIGNWIGQNQKQVEGIGLLAAGVAAAIGLANSALGEWNGLGILATGIAGNFGNSINFLGNPIALVTNGVKALSMAVLLLSANWETVKETAHKVWTEIQTVWWDAAGWFQRTLITPLSKGFKNMVNGIIGFLNGLIAGVAEAVNGIVTAVNKLKFTVPDWVPVLGGKNLGFYLKTVNMPRIPYLAQGAVLPANKPFMAVVGDQHHGTNVEAPLSTIQEAVAMVMGDQTAAILAGFEASVGVQRDILQAVLGIQIGDDVIGRAVSRYQRKMAVMRGR